MEKGSLITVKIEDVSDNGQGIAKFENLVIFVNGETVLGDEVEVEITKTKKNYAFAVAKRVIKPSMDREPSFCKYGGICGGCMFHNTTYKSELETKKKWIRDKLIRIAGIENPKVNEVVSDMDNRFRYRNKGIIHIENKVNKKNEGKIKVGFFKKNSNDIVECDECMIQERSVLIVAETIKNMASVISNKISKITVRTSFEYNAVMVDFHVEEYKASKKKPEEAMGFLGDPQLVIDRLFESLDEEGYILESIFVNGEVSIAGKNVILEKIGNLNFEISPNAFYQVNTFMAEKLFEIAKYYANMNMGGAVAEVGDDKRDAFLKNEEEKRKHSVSPKTILDLYCGVGTIGLLIREEDDYLYGIEFSKDAILNANRNSVVNSVTKAMFYEGKSEDILAGICLEQADKFDSRIGLENSKKIKKADVIILDPPRAGCHIDLIKSISKTECGRLIYISCDPGTLARDIKLFREIGFEFVEATPVDMFPGTGHVETCVLLSRKDPRNC